MDKDYIAANFQEAIYTLKEGTKSSYYWHEGSTILPNRLSISKETEMTSVRKKGRNNIDPTAGQMVSTFRKDEASPYKVQKPYVCRTQIWQKAEYPLFIGYGTAGITNKEGQVEDTGDLLVFFTPDQWQTIRIFIFAGMGNPNNLLEAFDYANKFLSNEPK